ncbi:MAG: hypothetical protein A2600_03385 [Candidatus Lambdaproteobacteria bacterium RIFOXYD1_FULL_56_27]|uniref:Uncharacterized protein n=1 Tax=Candidatus Lambdaproteobacteria bacterium RIFOXYD2_FULL_56_26 TaxID=1817773 RepID=A0A1F6H342_9PROT|nr:MAG: hypothetical protein A2426_11445 [Candidatus Lambdaproteobacteria bacterium RIFOXYC1_FULL_56_13]OGH04813.1 MAG: hypothetical protein A2557_07450 [Candidatus Lambdaproteobacteria bacterium RIFOXYD2_FULL_56_26]OGH09278.1 MAG: hypothetical protein A2600_03385 [Candidatus Lambdaproteobacteria bacterium RIFOXYD1_FULL_56_27]
MRRTVLILLALLALGTVLSSCKEGITSHNIILDDAEHGKKLYHGAKNCTACHGIALQGNGWIPSCYSCHNVMWNKDDHKVNRSGVMHKSGYYNAEANCSECHGGKALTGKRSRPSCYQCHGDKWTALSLHTLNKGGRYHGSGLSSPTSSGCTDCHGSDLKGSGSAPSCYSCHGAKWLYSSYPHTKSKDGVMHGPDLKNPNTYCVSCHGADLRGTTEAPSCYKCHGAEWLGGDDNMKSRDQP